MGGVGFTARIANAAVFGMLRVCRDGDSNMHGMFAIIFLALGAWSIWFGLFVDPADWSTL